MTRKQLELYGTYDIMLRPVQGNALSRAAFLFKNTEYSLVGCEKVKTDVIGSHDSCKVWIENSDADEEQFIGLIQLFSGEMATMLKTTTLVVYPVHANLVNVSARRRQCLVGSERTLKEFLPAFYTSEQSEENGSGEDEEMSVYGFSSSIAVRLCRGVRVTGESVRRKQRMKLLHEAIKLVVGDLQKCELKATFVKTRKLVE